MTAASAQVDVAEATPPLVLAVDFGTSSLRGQLYDSLGQALTKTESRRRHKFHTTAGGGSEADADHLLQQAFACIDETLATAGSHARAIAAVAVTTFVNNLLGVDAHGQAITPVTTYADTRAAGEVVGLRQEFDERQVQQRTGCRFHPSYLPARLRWLWRSDRAAFARVARWISLGEYLELQLFGAAAVTYSVASWSGLLDQNRLDWDEALLDRLPITREQLLPLTDFAAPRRGLRPEFARRWPALAQAPWFPAVGDGAAANIGSGCTSPARVALTMGSSTAMRAVLPAHASRLRAPAPPLPPGLWRYRVDARRALPGGALSEGGMVHAWMSEVLNLGAWEDLEAALLARRPDGHGLTVLPFLAGERSPGWAGHARGALHGLSLNTTALDILQAGMEAVAYRIARVYEQLRTLLPAEPDIVASGGALLSSPVWRRMVADVLARPVISSLALEASARGVALLALEALGIYTDVGDAPALTGHIHEPNLDRHAIYQHAMQRQEELYQKLVAQAH